MCEHSLFAECGGLQTGEGGLVSSPNYPNTYPSPSRCAWLLEAPIGHTITVSLCLLPLPLYSLSLIYIRDLSATTEKLN